MPTPPRTDDHDRQRSDASWLTSLSAERSWVAWLRTGLGAAAVTIGVGGVLPHVSTGEDWPYRLLGLGYGVFAGAIFASAPSVSAALRKPSTAVIASRLSVRS